MIRNNILSGKYREFSEAKGNQHIASEYAIRKLEAIIGKFRVKTVLEVGLGIGSICGSILAARKRSSNLTYEGTEANEFCLHAIKENLATDFERLKIYKSLTMVPRTEKYDLIIIDGKDANLADVKDLIHPNGIIAIEGDRIPQQESLRKIFPRHKYVHSISIKKNKSFSPFLSKNWQGGLKIIFIHPTLGQNTWWVKEKIHTKLKYFFRFYNIYSLSMINLGKKAKG